MEKLFSDAGYVKSKVHDTGKVIMKISFFIPENQIKFLTTVLLA